MTIQPAPALSRRTRYTILALCGGLVVILFCGAFAIPFLFESFSIKYKFGFNKALLRGGKLLGIGAALLFVGQLLLTARLQSLNRLVGMDRLVLAHKYNGILLALLALAHPLFVFAPEELTTLPLEKAFWPEMVGAVLLMGIFYMAAAALFKKELGLPFHLWMVGHKIGGALLLTALFVHLLFSSETFEQGVPRYAGLALGVICLWLFFMRRTRFLHRPATWVVSSVSPAGSRATRFTLAPDTPRSFQYLPGQFAFLSFPSSMVSPEAHPFTIASAPTTPNTLEFIIGKNGDWTAGIDCIREGERVLVEGPYGLFTHLGLEKNTPLIFIAGGIGITPILSMMRYINTENSPQEITLIWSNRCNDALFNAEELAAMKQKLPHLSIHLIFSGAPENDELTPKKLREYIGNQPTAHLFICGPPPMMVAVQAMLKGIGIPKRRVHTETFGF